MTAELNLLPCPFCGKETGQEDIDHDPDCFFTVSEHHDLDVNLCRIAWNRRATPALTAAGELLQLARDFYNTTVADTDVRIISKSEAKRDIAAKAADKLRDAISAALAADRAQQVVVAPGDLNSIEFEGIKTGVAATPKAQGAGMQVASIDTPELRSRLLAIYAAGVAKMDADKYYAHAMDYLRAQLTRQGQGEPVAYVNGDELDNTLDDLREMHQKKDVWFWAMPLYRASPAQASAAPAMRECPDCDGTQRISPIELCDRCKASGILPASAAQEQARAAVPENLREFVEAVANKFDGIDRETDQPYCMGCGTASRWHDAEGYEQPHADDCIVLRAEAMLAASPEPATAAVPVLPDAAMQASKGATDGAVGGA